METDSIKDLAHCCSPSQAAAFAVLCNSVREEVSSRTMSGVPSEDQPIEDLIQNLRMMEECMLEAIKRNDVNVVRWIGAAAKQMNPLLS